MAQARFSVRTAVAEGFDFWRQNWKKVSGALVLAAVAGVAVQISATTLAAMFLGTLITTVAQLPAQAALLRIALADLGAEPPERNGPLGLQWRGLETRLLSATVLVLLLGFIVAAVASFLLLAVMAGFLGGVDPKSLTTPGAVAAALSPAATVMLNVIMLIIVLAFVILATRLSLVLPATAAANSPQVFSSLKLTKGSVAQIFAVQLLIGLPLIALMLAASLYAGKNTGLLGGMNVILVGIAPFFLIPISVGALAYIYRRLSAPEGAA